MNYGLEITNKQGKLVISPELLVPYFTSKAQLVSVNRDLTFENSNRRATVFEYASDGNLESLVAQTLPAHGDAAAYLPVQLFMEPWPAAPGNYYYAIACIHELGFVADTPELYRFTSQNIPASSNTHGLQVFNQAGVKTFDSSYRHVMPLEVVQRTPEWQTGGPGYPMNFSAVPAKPCFFLSPLAREDRVYFVEPGQGDNPNDVLTGLRVTYARSYYRRLGTALRWEFIGGTEFWYGAPPDTEGTYYDGAQSGAGIVLLDASLYD